MNNNSHIMEQDNTTNTNTYVDDYNYPSLNRKDLMSLSTITNKDFPIRKFKCINTKRDWSVNLYNLDIERAVPKRSGVFTNKVDFINKNDDIEKSRPNPEKHYNHPDYILNCRDIDKAYPKKTNVFSKRIVNPLEPKYSLPKPSKPFEHPEPKFIKDSMNIDDIVGTKAKPLFPGVPKRNTNYEDHPRKPYERKVFYDNFNYRDVNEDCLNKVKFVRRTNPLQPEYGRYGGYIYGSRPYENSMQLLYSKDKGMRYMSNDDIYGSFPGSLNRYARFSCDRSSLYSSGDIEGAKAGTKMKGIVTKRCTNPLNPKYQYLGHTENLGMFGLKQDQQENVRLHRSGSVKQNRRYEITKEDEVGIENGKIMNSYNTNNNNVNDVNGRACKREFNKMSSQSCGNIFIPNHYNTNTNNNDVDIPEDDNDYDYPMFNPELYRKPNPNYELPHHKDLHLANLNPNSRLDTQRQKALLYPSSYDDTVKHLAKSNSCVDMRPQTNQQFLNHDPLFNKLQPKPCYERQMDYFIKDNNYEP